MKDRDTERAPAKGGRFKKVLSVGAGLALGALAGIVAGLVVGTGIAMVLGIL